MVEKEKLFQATRQVLEDIELVLHYHLSGEFFLPEDIGGEMTYRFFGQDLIVEFEWVESNGLEDNIVLGDYYNDENTIRIELKTCKEIDYQTIANIGEVITHEMTHWIQEMGGFEFPNEGSIDTSDYYLQPHELEAQYYGFSFESEYLNLPLNEVVDKWFEKYGKFHDFPNPDDIKTRIIESMYEYTQS